MPTLQHPGYCAIVAAWPLTLMALLCASLLMQPSVELQLLGCHLKSCTKTTPRVSRQQQLFLSHTNVCEILSILKVFSVPPLKKNKFNYFQNIFRYSSLCFFFSPSFFVPFRWHTNIWKAGRHSHRLNCISVWNKLYSEPSSLKWAE